MGQFLPGTDFVTSGYSVMPRRDNTFGGGNYDADDIDEWLTIQRDWQVDGGHRADRGGRGCCACASARRARCRRSSPSSACRPSRTRRSRPRRSATAASDVPDRDRAADVEAADELLARGVSALDVALALDRRGFEDVAEAIVGMLRQRVAADYLQTSAVIEPDGLVRSAVNDPNLYLGPGTGYRLEGERWELLQALPHVVDPRRARRRRGDGAGRSSRRAAGDARRRSVRGRRRARPGVRATALRETIAAWLTTTCSRRCRTASAREGGAPRLVRVRRAADVAFIAHDGARLSGSGVALGLQSKGTAVIHRADLQPLDNLELFGMSPLYTLESYRAMGRNAAGYALGQRVGPVPTELDNFARAKLIVRTTLLHAQEAQAVDGGRGSPWSSAAHRSRGHGRAPVDGQPTRCRTAAPIP